MSATRARLVALLAIALHIALPTAPAAGSEDDRLIARVNGHAIRLSDVYREVEALPLGDQVAIRQQLDGFAESMVREEILFQWALAEALAADPALRAEVKGAVVERLIHHRVRERVDVSGDDVRAFYEQNASAIRGESVRAAHIRLAERGQCETLLREIPDESAFRAAAAERSLDRESAAKGGDIGLFMNHGGPYGFETALFDMRPGEMRVFDTEAGCSLVRVTERLVPPLPPLEAVSGRIRSLLETRQERSLLEDLLGQALSSVTVERPSP